MARGTRLAPARQNHRRPPHITRAPGKVRISGLSSSQPGNSLESLPPKHLLHIFVTLPSTQILLLSPHSLLFSFHNENRSQPAQIASPFLTMASGWLMLPSALQCSLLQKEGPSFIVSSLTFPLSHWFLTPSCPPGLAQAFLIPKHISSVPPTYQAAILSFSFHSIK